MATSPRAHTLRLDAAVGRAEPLVVPDAATTGMQAWEELRATAAASMSVPVRGEHYTRLQQADTRHTVVPVADAPAAATPAAAFVTTSQAAFANR